MGNKILVLAISLLLFSGMLALAGSEATVGDEVNTSVEDEFELADLSDSPWPMFRGNLNHTGRSPYNTDYIDGTERWNFTTGEYVLSSPAIGEYGTIYVGSYDGNLYALNPDGTEKWSFATSSHVQSSPAIGSDGTIYVGSSDNNLYAVNPDGTERWNFTTGLSISSSPAIGEDGTIYAGSNDDNLYALNPDGTERWNFTTGVFVYSSPAIGSDGTIYVGSGDNNLYALNPDGTERWNFTTGHYVRSSPAIGSDDTIYVGSSDNNLYAVNPDGTERWNFTTGLSISSSPAIGEDGTIYVGSNDGNLYVLNPDGTEKWNFTTGSYVNMHSSPAIGSDGTIYFGSCDNNLYAVYPDGTEKWGFLTDGDVYSSPAIGSDGTIYFGSMDNNLYSVGGKDIIPPTVSISSPSEGAIISSSLVTVEWSGSDGEMGIDHYEIQINSGDWTDIGVLTSYTFTDLSDGSYTVDVKAVDVASNTNTDTVNFIVDTTPPPSVPQNLQSIDGDEQINLTWDPPSDDGGSNITEYKIYRGTTSGILTLHDSVGGDTTTYIDTGLTNGVTFYYQVSAVNSAGEGDKSAEVSATPSSSDTDDSDTDGKDDGSIPGFTSTILLMALVTAVVIYYRKDN
ncbi:MAG: PQQ-binding-like beta-propeller repeat protein [Candidatus Thermoplasmatota archaeon]|nr:PQQ-binding-like beta-propeller repeat protein [Candidatus Thermoplasmatota archaeon]